MYARPKERKLPIPPIRSTSPRTTLTQSDSSLDVETNSFAAMRNTESPRTTPRAMTRRPSAGVHRRPSPSMNRNANRALPPTPDLSSSTPTPPKPVRKKKKKGSKRKKRRKEKKYFPVKIITPGGKKAVIRSKPKQTVRQYTSYCIKKLKVVVFIFKFYYYYWNIN